MQQTKTKSDFSGLVRWIDTENLMDECHLRDALEQAITSQQSLIEFLIENQLIDFAELAYRLSKHYGLPLFDLNSYDLNHFPKNILSREIIERYHVFPFYKKENCLYIASYDPTNQDSLIEIRFLTGIEVRIILCDAVNLMQCIKKFLNANQEEILGQLEEIKTNDSENTHYVDLKNDDAPIIRFVHQTLLSAASKGVSDIHFEPTMEKYRIRMRQDGLLYQNTLISASIANRLTARLKIMAQLDIAEHRIPQDGRFDFTTLQNKVIDCRVSTCPTVHGEKVVVRLLDPSSLKLEIDELGFEPSQKSIFKKYLAQPQGMILVTGPTGSGKTVTLYTGIDQLNTENRNIITIEDPIEIQLYGINQVNINKKAGLTFASALRSFLRQDPDIIMVGEMRDLETADIAIKAAQTGHLVLSTLHTNSATETLTRLINIGCPNYNIATSVSLIIAQRLARRLCDACKEKETIPLKTLREEGIKDQKIIFKAKGCEHCTKGYKGRIGIFEMLPVTENLSDAILSGANAMELSKIAKDEGMITLREAGLLKVGLGITSLEEINRVTRD